MTSTPVSEWRSVFMGTPEIAVPALRALAEHTQLQLVITQPDRPAGRGRKLTAPPVKQAAETMGVPVWQPETMRGAEADPRLANVDLIVVMAYGELLRQPVLDSPRVACLNLHASLLPRWRGASPLQAVLRAGDTETGTSVMGMVRALDAGPVYHQQPLVIPQGASLPWLHDALAVNAADALAAALTTWPTLAPEPQDEAQVTWCGKLTPADGEIDWCDTAEAIERQVRAYTPVPGCWTTVDGTRFGILAISLATDGPDLAPGATALHQGAIVVGCGDGCVALLRVKPAGRQAMDAAAWRNGYAVPPQFGTPSPGTA